MNLTYKSKNLNEVSRLGIIVLQSDASLELEFQKALAGSSVVCHHARIQNALEVNPETLSDMKNHLPNTASLLPQELKLKAIAYACTSGSVMIGSEEVSNLIQKHHPKAKITNPMSAAIKACNKLKVKNIAFLSPYIDEVSKPMRNEFEKNGINIATTASFNEKRDDKVATIDEESTLNAIIEINKQNPCDAVFASCTNLRTFNIIKKAEQKIQKPVLSSNQTLLWHLLKLSNENFQPKNLGVIFSK